MTQLLIFSAIVVTYLIGSIPFGYIYGKLFKKIDIREHGSGNIGATNILRTFGTKAGLIVLSLDILKGVIPVVLARMLLPEICELYQWLPVAIAISAILGHTFTVFLSFKGGKGVATAAGVMLALVPTHFLIAILIFVAIVAITRYVSLGSMMASLFLVTRAILYFALSFENITEETYVYAFMLLLGIFVVSTHKSNIQRLIKGNENKLSFQKK